MSDNHISGDSGKKNVKKKIVKLDDYEIILYSGESVNFILHERMNLANWGIIIRKYLMAIVLRRYRSIYIWW